MKIRLNRHRLSDRSMSIKNLRSANKLLLVYSIITTICLFILAYKYMVNSNNNTVKVNEYNVQVAQLTYERDYYQNNSRMFSDTVASLLDVTTELNIEKEYLIADNQFKDYQLDEFYQREELFDRYGFFLYNRRGERNDLSYDRLRTLEELVEDSCVPNPELILSIIYLESGGMCEAYNNSSSASGFGQFLPSTARSVWKNLLGNDPEEWEDDMIFDPDLNLQMTVAYMDYLIKKHGGPYEALRQYSGSGTNTAHLNGYVATLDSYLRHTDVGSFDACEAAYQASK